MKPAKTNCLLCKQISEISISQNCRKYLYMEEQNHRNMTDDKTDTKLNLFYNRS